MRLIDADALIAETMKNRCADCDRRKGVKRGKITFVYDFGEAPCRACDVGDMIETLDEAPTVGGWISVKEVASIISDLFGDKCACNNNDIDEWLPKYCEYKDTDCPYPPGASCWEQYIKHLGEKPVEVKND